MITTNAGIMDWKATKISHFFRIWSTHKGKCEIENDTKMSKNHTEK